MRRVLWCLVLVVLPACAVAFSPGTTPAPTPAKFEDTDHSALREEQKKEEASGSAYAPTFGMSLVVGGTRMDGGVLPKAPFPVAVVH